MTTRTLNGWQKQTDRDTVRINVTKTYDERDLCALAECAMPVIPVVAE